ncbi:unnamed protein product [Spirodela intermedia]|uniref:Uncharacterized protein n=1 Tax=Spirodela intermedia TaxID=51605 RepID=A0A7I8K2K2_SPIIN|nr:unnamed protein product [Spirodela intermedia]
MHRNARRFSATAAAAQLSVLLNCVRISIEERSAGLLCRSHAAAFPLGLHRHPYLASRLISAYSLLGSVSLSRFVFEWSLQEGNPLLWNSMLAAYSRDGHFREAMSLFSGMLPRAPPDNYSLAILAKVSGELADLASGGTIHSLVVRLGFASDVVLLNSLMGMYLRCGESKDARKLFDEMPRRSVSSWNGLMSGSGEAVWDLLLQMQREGLRPDEFTISTVLPFCTADSTGRWLPRGREIHGFVLRNGLGLGSELDCYIGSCLIDMYSKRGSAKLGRFIFDRIAWKNVVAWTAMISGYVQSGELEEGLILFRMMQHKAGVAPNKVTLLGILPAIGSLASLISGKQIHGFAIKEDLIREASLNNALIDMYSKCGSLDSSKRLFDQDGWQKDAISWSCIISSYGLHGRGEEATSIFRRMIELGMDLDHITCMGILSACGRSGLVAQGLEIYTSLIDEHRILPTAEISSCVVDMLCRAGDLQRALKFIDSTPSAATPSAWGTLLGFSVAQGSTQMRDLACDRLLHLEPDNPSNLVALSNLHASSGRWDAAAEVRARMRERGLSKLPGCSWITINGVLHSFFAADYSSLHDSETMIFPVLESLHSHGT